MTQLVELQEALPKFEAAGIKLYAISYDTSEELAEFAQHHGITYPLLSDKGSKVIRKLGIQNHHVTKEQVPYYGIPFPGTYLLDESGAVAEKFFSRSLAAREAAESVIDSALGEILLGEEEPTGTGGDDDIRISATYHGGGGTLKAAVRRQIVVRFELAPGLHIYDEPVPQGMVATRIRVEGPEGLHTGDVSKPTPHPLKLPGLDQPLSVWDGRVDFAIPVWADDRVVGLMDEVPEDAVEIDVHVDYQACRIPQSETLSLRVPVAPYLGHDLPGQLAGAVMTTMDTRKLIMRKVRRGLLRSPIKGLRYLRETMAQVRRGPAHKPRPPGPGK
ncbi:MAG: peroxiredoxin [Deltaproteobacteria bacterium]|jgi:peroxiredoxin|nr:peroxiredoxin [Deltaproteobacteria bacterium]